MKGLSSFRSLANAIVCAAFLSISGGLPVFGDETIPVIVMEGVPLSDAIRNLARQAGGNFMLDPALSDSTSGQYVTVRWENMSAKEALARLVKEHGLVALENPATTVTRITFANRVTRAVDGNLLGSSTNVIPLIVMAEVPLNDAIRNLSRQAGLELIIDPNLQGHFSTTENRFVTPPHVSLRLQNVTARQTILALCENYDLELVRDSDTGKTRVKARE